jgi:prevent-host-death family protein
MCRDEAVGRWRIVGKDVGIGVDNVSDVLYVTYTMYKIIGTGEGEAVEQRLGITEARKKLARIVDEVKHKGENYVIVRHGQPAAALVPMDVYERWKREREELFDSIRRVQQLNSDADPDQVIREVLEAQQAVRRDASE